MGDGFRILRLRARGGRATVVEQMSSKTGLLHRELVKCRYAGPTLVSLGAELTTQPRPIRAIGRAYPTQFWSLTDIVRVIEDWEARLAAKMSGTTVVG
jgi:hypothetical protein